MVVHNPACGESSGSIRAVLEVLSLSARLTASSTDESVSGCPKQFWAAGGTGCSS